MDLGKHLCAVALAVLAGGVLLCVGSSSSKAQWSATVRQDRQSGPELYHTACASCHGVDGRGTAPFSTGFEIPLPDFKNCEFASREADEDWLATIHRGGNARGFDRRMPAFERALRPDQIQALVEYLRGLCVERNWPRGELNLPRALLTEKAYPEDEAILTSEVALRGSLAVDNLFIYEKRLGRLDQFEIAIPFAVHRQEGDIDAASRTLVGVGDIALGWKRVLVHSLSTGSIFSVMGELMLPTGSERDGFGAGTSGFEPSLLYGQLIAPFGFIQLQAGAELPFYTAHATNELYARGVIGRSYSQPCYGRMWSPMFEFMARRELESEAKTDWDYVPQLQVTLSRRRHVRACGGVRVPLTRLSKRPMTAMLYLLWDWYDGGLFEGW
jgi:mono/diheme cytochrome c family protein